MLIALFGVSGTAASAVGVQWVTGWLEERRARRQRRTARIDETRTVLEDAATAFVTARLALDNALLTPGHHHLDTATLYAPIVTHESRIALRLGSSNPIVKHYSEAKELWSEAVNLAIAGDLQKDSEQIIEKRNLAFDSHARFLDLAAPLVGPGSED